MGEVERTVETDELRADQATIRAELYGGMMDAYAGGDAANVGRRVVLGPNFTRSARPFGLIYHDSLVGQAQPKHKGKADIISMGKAASLAVQTLAGVSFGSLAAGRE